MVKKKAVRKTGWVGKPTAEQMKECEGFVYMIINTKTQQYYIGKKSFWSRRTLKPLKGKKRKRHTVVESDWKNYYGSSNWLKEDIAKYGEGMFSRQILKLCKSKYELSYNELLWQIKLDVLNDKMSYNGIINVRLRAWKDKDGIRGEVEENPEEVQVSE